MMSRKIFAANLFIFLVLTACSYSQQHFSNKWSVYTSMKNVTGVGISGTSVWAASTGGLFSFDYNNPDGTIKKYTILDGLLGNELTANTIDNFGNIWCGELDGGISVFYPSTGQWRVVTDIQNSGETNRKIYDLYQYGNSMFISTQFSLIQFNVAHLQFVDQPYRYLGSLQTPNPVHQTVVVNDTVWAASQNGIAFANINSALPIQTNWRNFVTGSSALLTNVINSVVYFDGKVVFGTDSGMVYYQSGTLYPFLPVYNGSQIRTGVGPMAVSNGSLYISTYRGSSDVYRIDRTNLTLANLVMPNVQVNVMKVNSAGELFVGTATGGVNYFKNNTSNFIVPNGPNSNTIIAIDVDQNSNVFACSGGTGEGIFRYNGSSWRNFTTQNTPNMGSGDFRHVYASHFNGSVYFGGYGNGLLKITGDNVFRYDNQNSCLRSLSGNFVLVEGMKEDNSGNMWLINRGVQYPIVQFNEGPPPVCNAYPMPYNQAATTVLFLDIDNYNTKWMSFPNDVEGSPRGVAYFNEALNPTGTIINTTYLGQNVNAVYQVIVEKNGEVWIATDNGIVIVRDPYQVVANPGSTPSVDKMRIIENGLSTPLLENVQCIAVDALNNKWIGTISNGLIYVSSDGSTLLARYNTLNSPLPDDKITCIVVDPRTGIAYFGTGKGLVSLQTIAVQPLENCDKITVGPSPFVIPNSSLLKIDGLVAESTVKILSISGTLVYEFTTEGGRVANWDGRDLNGNLVSSGIYIVAGYNKDATKVCTGKIAVVRR